LLERVPVRGSLGQLVCQRRQERRGAAGRGEEADGSLPPDQSVSRWREAAGAVQAAPRHRPGPVLCLCHQHAGQPLCPGQEQHAQRARGLDGLDLSQPGRQQYRAVLLLQVGNPQPTRRPPDTASSGRSPPEAGGRMYRFILRRLAWMIPSFFAVSLVSFIIMRLPPGDFVTSYAADLATSGAPADQATLDNLPHHYGLARPLYVQSLSWVGNALQGDLGVSFEYRAPVAQIIWNRLGMTFLVASCTLLFVWAVAFPIGIYSALRQHKLGDYIVTFLGFIGMATPNFLLALFVMYVSVVYLGYSVGGLF